MLPDADKNRLGETWQGYEQVFASAYQKFVEVDLNIAIKDMQSYSTERWIKYTFNSENEVLRPPIYTSTQDISMGVNLNSRYLLRFKINGGTPIEVDIRGANPLSTTINEIVSKINAAVGFDFARTIFENTIIQLVSPTSGPGSSIEILVPSNPLKDASEFVLGLQTSDLPAFFPEFPYVYMLPESNIVNIPTFQDKIRDEASPTIFSSGVDYAVEASGIVSFKELPNEILWAKKTLYDEETPWHNFGFLMDIYQKNTPAYLSILQGLWYAFWTGPKPENLKIALYLLFGLPTAQEDATVTRVTPTEVETTSDSGVIHTFTIPTDLIAIVSVGQSVTRFQPLVSGIDIFDKISRPGFITNEIGRAGIERFLTEQASRGVGDTDETKALRMLEEHTFLPQISVDAFISPDINLGNVKIFLDTIKPLSKTYLFQVIVGTFKDELAIEEKLGLDIDINITPNVDSNQTTFLEQSDLDSYETVDNDALNLDSDGVLMQEDVEVEVYSFGFLIDSFVA